MLTLELQHLCSQGFWNVCFGLLWERLEGLAGPGAKVQEIREVRVKNLYLSVVGNH